MKLFCKRLLKVLFTLVLLGSFFLGTVSISGVELMADEVPTDQSTSNDFNQKIRQFLLENPEVVIEALRRYKDNQKEIRARKRAALLRENLQTVLNDPHTPASGNLSGDVSIVEFFDYNCPYCRKVTNALKAVVKKDNNIRIVYKEFPILGSDSHFAALAALAAKNQGKYTAFHNALMGAKGKINETQTLKIAETVGLDVKKLQKDMQNQTLQSAISNNLELAQTLGIKATPTFIVGRKIIQGAVNKYTLRKAIKDARAANVK